MGVWRIACKKSPNSNNNNNNYINNCPLPLLLLCVRKCKDLTHACVICALCTRAEYIFACCVELMGNIYVAILVGNVLNILASLNRQSEKYVCGILRVLGSFFFFFFSYT